MDVKILRVVVMMLVLASALVLAFALADAAHANDGGYTWGMTVNPTPVQQTADVITAGTVFDYGHVGPSWVYVTPWVHVWDPSWAGPACATIRYRNGVEQDSQHIGAGAPTPYVWSLNMTPPVVWKITVTCPLPQGATGTPSIDVTFSSELPPAAPIPAASAPAPIPAKVVTARSAPSPVPVAQPRPTPSATRSPATETPPPVLSAQTQSPAASPEAVGPTPSPSPVHQDPIPQPSMTTSGKPTSLTFDAQAPTSPRSHRGGRAAVPWVIAIAFLATAFFAARYHWGWR